MALNDHYDEFNADIEDEDGSLQPVPATEIGALQLAVDRGSGSYAEDGPVEITEGAMEIGSAAMFGPSEIGAASAADRMAAEIGKAQAADEYMAEMGSAAMFGPTEIGDSNVLDHQYEIGGSGDYAEEGPTEIGAEEAVVKVIEKARDNRQPAPPMRAVDVDAPLPDDEDESFLTDTCIGAAEAVGKDVFPLLTQLLQRAGAGMPPRVVRVDTEESYKAFRAEHSPEMAELSERVAKVSQKLEDHIVDPSAHDDLSDDIEDLTQLGAQVDAVEEEKRVELWMPKRFDGLVTAWREGNLVCASMTLPGSDGEVRICTSFEPIKKCVAEMARHAAESGVPASTVVGVLPAMGCVLGAGTALKEMAAAAPSILQRPEASSQAPFMVRIEPKTSPALAALAMLAMLCKKGDAQACAEWQRLASQGAGPVKQAMAEALQLVKAAA